MTKKFIIMTIMAVVTAVTVSAKEYTIGWVETDATVVQTMWSVKEELSAYGISDFSLIQLDDEALVEKATADLKQKLYVEGVNPRTKQWCSVIEKDGQTLLRVGNYKNGGATILTVAVYKVITHK